MECFKQNNEEIKNETFNRVDKRFMKQIVEHFDKKIKSVEGKVKVKKIRKLGVTSYVYYNEKNDIIYIIQVEYPKERTYDVWIQNKKGRTVF